MCFPALHDRLHSRRLVAGQVPGGDVFGGGVDDHVTLLEQVVQAPAGGQARLLHRLLCFGRGGEHRQPVRGGLDAPVGDDVRDSDQVHVGLGADGVGDTFADDPVPVHSDIDRVHDGVLP